MKTLAAVLLLAVIQGRTLYEDPTRSIRIHGYTQAEGGTLENGDFEFSMRGNPAVVESRVEGMVVTAPTLSGTVSPASSSARAFIRVLNVEGGSVVTLDSAIAHQAQVDLAKRAGAAAPAEPDTREASTIRSASFGYLGTGGEGTLAIPQAFTIESHSDGRVGDTSFNQTLTAEGTQATIKLDPATSAEIPVKSGTISGPVKLKISRSETKTGAPQPTLSELEGFADNVEIDLQTARTITLRGNVKVSGFSGLYQGTSEGDVVVVTLDQAMKPIRIRITGDPTKSTLRERKQGGVR